MVPAPRTATLLICLCLVEGLVEVSAVLLGGMLQAPAGDNPHQAKHTE
jgi:hypothetical protein